MEAARLIIKANVAHKIGSDNGQIVTLYLVGIAP